MKTTHRASGFYVEYAETLANTKALFFGFRGGQHWAIGTKAGRLGLAKFLEDAAIKIRRIKR